MIEARQIYNWFKDAGEEGDYVDGMNDLTGQVEFKWVVIDGRFDLGELADYLNKKSGNE